MSRRVSAPNDICASFGTASTVPTPLTVIESVVVRVLGAGEIGQPDGAGQSDDGESRGSDEQQAFHREPPLSG